MVIYVWCRAASLNYLTLDNVDKAEKSYQKAFDLAKDNLPSTHPIRLGLVLNYSVFFYEIKNNSAKACELAKKVGS